MNPSIPGQTDLWTLGVIAALAGVSVLTRCFFFILDRPWSFPPWAHHALNYAPIAALAAVVVPEVITTHGILVSTFFDARLYGALAGAAWYYWRRGVLGTIVAGMAVYLPLHLALGW